MGHHTTTKVARNKRPDTRPNGKERRRISKLIHDKDTVQHLKVTRVQKHERVKRELNVIDPEFRTEKKMNSSDKHMRALKKKLSSIEILVQKQDNGETLDAQQLEKVETLDDVMREIEIAMIPEEKQIKRKNYDNYDSEEADDDDDDEEEEEDDDGDDDDESERIAQLNMIKNKNISNKRKLEEKNEEDNGEDLSEFEDEEIEEDEIFNFDNIKEYESSDDEKIKIKQPKAYSKQRSIKDPRHLKMKRKWQNRNAGGRR
jgi:hypothetical protein